MDDVKIMVNKSSEWCYRESVKIKILSGFLYMKQRQDVEIKWRQSAGVHLNLLVMSWLLVITSMIYIFLCYHRDWEHDNENND